ncbi:hypothetical protein F5B20DRAFT_513864 [Whalleya microplaca]|nr:hypothetical protein F5B20DRAFT_513864 [Whalleya microplaca]
MALSNAEKVEGWYAEGCLSPERILEGLDRKIKERYHEQQSTLEKILRSTSTDECDGEDTLTKSTFVSLLQTKGSLPESAAGSEAGYVIYASIAYLSKIPFPPTPEQCSSVPVSLTATQLSRGLVWLLPGYYERMTEASNWCRTRTPADHRRMIFQSLATAYRDQAHDSVKARELAPHNAYDVSESSREFAGPNHDDDGDEMYHDVLDVLYATQPETPLPLAPPKRDDFRPVAKRLVQDRFRFSTLAIPRQRFVALARILLALQFEPNNGEPVTELSSFDGAVDSLVAAFCEDAQADVITWPMFDHTLKNTAPYLFAPLYRLLSNIFFGRAGPETLDASSAPTSSSSILTLPLQSQLASFLTGSIYFGDFRRVHHYIGPGRPSTATLAEAMGDILESAVLVLSGTAPTGSEYIFGVFSPSPDKDVSAIQEVPEDTEGRERCLIFQLSPVQDVFRGAVERPGWALGEDGLRFGQDGGVGLFLLSSLQEAMISHRVAAPGGSAGTYKANLWRGSWDLTLEVSEIELWGEFLSTAGRTLIVRFIYNRINILSGKTLCEGHLCCFD